ncbi:MAG: gamma-glutamyltransferase [Cryobacterium sp.]|nr:gamma-glutamyltransferase [Cryobacterium sp.]MBX3103503.1 gamma-glutamyltransferase [Cryobacterium sp.]
MDYTPPNSFTTRPTLRGHFGMTASTHWIASACGQSVLERGGNAFDASVAAGFVLQVVEPHLNGPGGDLVGIFSTAKEPGIAKVLMGQGPAPTHATMEKYRQEGLDFVPGAGALAAAVPGATDAWLLLLKDYGTWELADVLQFAIDYAKNGHPLHERVCATIGKVQDLFQQHWPTSAELWNPRGAVPRELEVFKNPALARTFERLVLAAKGNSRAERIDAARTEWAEGFVAQEIESFVKHTHRHSDGKDHAGVIRASDLAEFRATLEPAISAEFRGVTVAKAGPWSQGPALLEALGILEAFGDEQLDPSTAQGAHLVLEAEKLALADRDSYFGDYEQGLFVTEELLSKEYLASRRELVGERASVEFRPGQIARASQFFPPLVAEVSVEEDVALAAGGEPTVSKSGVSNGDTCHLDVLDRWGNLVSITPSGGWLQSSPTIPELGFCLGTRLQMTWLTPGAPSSLAPGKRPRTTLTPTLLLKDGRAFGTLGSPGGDQQDQWQLPYLLRTIVGGYSPQQAIDAPTFHTTSFPDSFWPRRWVPGGAVVENRLGEEVIRELESRGHLVTRAGDWSLGRLSAVGIDPDGSYFAAANPRGMQGYAVGR